MASADRSAAATRFEWERALLASNLPSTRRHVLLTLGVYMNADGSGARPGIARLVDGTGLRDRAIRGHLSAAVDAGWLELVSRGHRRGDGRARASEYRATTPISTGTGMPVDGCGQRSASAASTGMAVPLENDSQAAAIDSLPARDATSTGTPVPPTKQLHQPSPSPTADELDFELEVRRRTLAWEKGTGEVAGRGVRSAIREEVRRDGELDRRIENGPVVDSEWTTCDECHGSTWHAEVDVDGAAIPCRACDGVGRRLAAAS